MCSLCSFFSIGQCLWSPDRSHARLCLSLKACVWFSLYRSLTHTVSSVPVHFPWAHISPHALTQELTVLTDTRVFTCEGADFTSTEYIGALKTDLWEQIIVFAISCQQQNNRPCELMRIFHQLIWIFPFCPNLVVHERTLIILCTLLALNKPENEGNQETL